MKSNIKSVLFFSKDCPDTAPFVAELKALGVDYEEVEILSNLTNFKRFTRLRDHHPAFDHTKQNGYIGIPALVIDENRVVLDIEELEKVNIG